MALTPGTRRLLREAASWTVIAVVGAAAFIHLDTLKSGTQQLLGLPTADEDSARQDAADGMQVAANIGSVVEIKAGRNGHFNTEAEINGRPVEVMIDTGASVVALSYEDAERAGLYINNSDFTGAVSTANGIARVAPVTLDRITIGDITVRDVPAAVAEPGRLRTSLLGMTFLNKLSRFDMRAGTLVLQD